MCNLFAERALFLLDLMRFDEKSKKGFNRQVAEPLDFIGAGERSRTAGLLITIMILLFQDKLYNNFNRLKCCMQTACRSIEPEFFHFLTQMILDHVDIYFRR